MSSSHSAPKRKLPWPGWVWWDRAEEAELHIAGQFILSLDRIRGALVIDPAGRHGDASGGG